MTVKRAKIQIDVEATTEGAVRGMDRVATATDKSRKAVEKQDAALKAASREYQVASARAANLADRIGAFGKAYDHATRSVNAHAAAQAKAMAANAGSSNSLAGLAASAGKYAGAAGLATAATIGAASVVSDLAAESVKVQGIFSNLPFALEPARAATRGLADDMTLARLSIMANQSGVAKSAESFGELAGMAQTLAMKMGRDVNDTIERVTLGIAKQEREVLDELVILPRMEEMWRQHAKTLGKTTAELTDHEKTAAFTASALQALRSATQGVTVDMGGAGVAIAKATVQAQNLRTRVLGGEEATTDLDDGLRAVALTFDGTARDVRTYGVEADKLRKMLQDLNVATDQLAVSNRKLGDDLEEIQRQELARLENMVFAKTATDESIAQMRELRGLLHDTETAGDKAVDQYITMQAQQETVARNAAKAEKERLDALQLSIAFLQGKGDEEALLNAALAEELEIRIKILEAEGKSEEIAKIRTQQKLDEQRKLGESLRPKRGGRGDNRAAEERERRRFAAAQAEREHWEHINQLMANLAESRAQLESMENPFTASNMQLQASVEMQREALRLDQDRAVALAEIDERRAQREASGIEDPIARMEAEARARVELIDVRMRAANDDIAMADLQEQRDAEHHALAMARLEERKRMEAEVHERRQAIAQESMDLAIGAAQAIVQGAVIEGKALRSVVAATAKGEAMRHGLVLGPSALAGAAFQFAWGNIPQGTALLTAAGQSFAFAASMAALGAAAGAFGGGGRGKQVGGFGADAFGAGGPAANSAPRSASGGGWDIGGQVPLSEETKGKVSATAAMSGARGAPVAVQQTITISALDVNDAAAIKIVQAIERAGKRQGGLVAGGRR